MAIDIAGFITYLKDHAVEHGFHVHDERHFIETYSLRQAWEVDLHPESACDGPLDLNLAFDVEPRVLLTLEEQVSAMDDAYSDPEGDFRLPLMFNWALPPLENSPDLVVLAAELAGVGGVDLPIEVSGVESTGALSTAPSCGCRSSAAWRYRSSTSCSVGKRCVTPSTVAATSVSGS